MQIRINNFEGPLDLLLQLIEKNELDITEVSLLQVAEQYLAHLDKIEDKKPDELADFLLIATKLLYIKSKVLLPGLEIEEEEDSIDLAKQLRMYKKYVEASKIIEHKFRKNIFAFSRPENKLEVKVIFEPPKSLTAHKLKGILEDILKQLELMTRLPKKSLEKVVSIKEKIRHIQALLAKQDLISFHDLARHFKNKTDIIVSFLGILELNKQREVLLEQEKAFGDIIIRANKTE
jgi:segregation and condensation protein A